jgi:hypothetical protein
MNTLQIRIKTNVIQWSIVVNGVPAVGAEDMHILSTAALKRHPQRVCHPADKVRPALPVKTLNILSGNTPFTSLHVR